MKVIKKNQIIIFVMALMLIVAGYLSFSTNANQNSNLMASSKLADSEEMASIGDAQLVSANVTDEENITKLDEKNKSEGNNESQSNKNSNTGDKNNNSDNQTNGNTVDTNAKESENKSETNNEAKIKETDNYFVQSRLDRDTMYSQTLETYQKIIEKSNISEEQKSIAQKEITKINNQKNAIMIAENLIKVKGFEDLIIFVNEGNVSVIIKANKLEQKQIAQIQNIVTRELSVKLENVNISNK